SSTVSRKRAKPSTRIASRRRTHPSGIPASAASSVATSCRYRASASSRIRPVPSVSPSRTTRRPLKMCTRSTAPDCRVSRRHRAERRVVLGVARLAPYARAVRAPAMTATYDEAENIAEFLRRTRAAAPDADVLVIDDNSPDGTAEIAKAVGATLGRIDVLHRPRKEGLGAA